MDRILGQCIPQDPHWHRIYSPHLDQSGISPDGSWNNLHERSSVEDPLHYLAEVPHKRYCPELYSASITSLAQE